MSSHPDIYDVGVYVEGLSIYNAQNSGLHAYIGGRKYKLAKIGSQIWMAENLDFKFDGLVVGASGVSSTEPRGNYYNNNEDRYGYNGKKYGILYNWAAIKYLEDNKSQLIPGWHVPTKDEWDSLVDAVGTSQNAGLKLKSTTGWEDDKNGDDSTDFAALPSGGYNGDLYYYVNNHAYYWAVGTNYASVGLGFDITNGIQILNTSYEHSRSLRLVKD